MIPPWWSAVVLVLGVFRIVRLIGWDDLPPIMKVRARVTGERISYDATRTGDPYTPIYTFRRPTLAHFLGCAYCQGFWMSAGAMVAWWLEPRWTLYVLAIPALSAAVGIVARRLDP